MDIEDCDKKKRDLVREEMHVFGHDLMVRIANFLHLFVCWIHTPLNFIHIFMV